MDLVNPIVRRWIREGEEDPAGFWGRQASRLPWLRAWDRAFVPEYPSFRWFVGGLTNLAHAALDHHVAAGRGGHAALVYANERGARRRREATSRSGARTPPGSNPAAAKRRAVARSKPRCSPVSPNGEAEPLVNGRRQNAPGSLDDAGRALPG